MFRALYLIALISLSLVVCNVLTPFEWLGLNVMVAIGLGIASLMRDAVNDEDEETHEQFMLRMKNIRGDE